MRASASPSSAPSSRSRRTRAPRVASLGDVAERPSLPLRYAWAATFALCRLRGWLVARYRRRSVARFFDRVFAFIYHAGRAPPHPVEPGDVCPICLGALSPPPPRDDGAPARAADPSDAPLTDTRKRRRRQRRLWAARAARDAKPILHCAWGCGRPVHAECIERWLRQKNVCVFCNAPFR